MILHTTMPLEVVWENFERMADQELREIRVHGVTMLVEPAGPYQGKIVRLISPNPQDYLNPRWAPGRLITFHPELD